MRQALKGYTPNSSISFIVTWKITFTMPPLCTRVTSLPSFFDKSSLGLTYSACFPFNQPNI